MSKTGFFSVVAAFALFAGGATAGEPKAVIELFTSQGCSSCPPADKLMAEYAERDDLLVLSFNVDYWDYLGWDDTLASPKNTERQYAYAAARGESRVYTPQAIINGVDHVVGHKKPDIDSVLRREPRLPVSIELEEKDDAVAVTIDKKGTDVGRAALWLALYDSEVAVPIERGENTGKTITYSNVVRMIRPIAMWNGGEMTVDLPKSEMTKAHAKHCAVILQTETSNGLPGRILGAAMMDLER